MSQTWGETLARQNRIQRRQQVITTTDLTVAGLVQSIVIDVPLPANAVIQACSIFLTTAFSGGTVSAVDVQVGDDTNDDDSLVAAYDAFTASANIGLWSNGDTLGIAPVGDPSGLVLEALFTSITDDLDNLTAGSLTINVWFQESINP